MSGSVQVDACCSRYPGMSRSRGNGRSSAPAVASLVLPLGPQASDSGVELGSLLTVDPPGRDPFR